MNELTGSFKALFARDASLLKTCMMFSLFFTTYNVDVTWLDEIAEGLKNATNAINQALLNLRGIQIDANPNMSLVEDPCVTFLEQ